MAQILDQRFSAIDRAIAALKLQYPTYARQLEVQYLARLAARLRRSGTADCARSSSSTKTCTRICSANCSRGAVRSRCIRPLISA